MPALIQCGFEKQTAQYMEPKNIPEINENTILSDLITYSFVTVSLDHPVQASFTADDNDDDDANDGDDDNDDDGLLVNSHHYKIPP